MEAIRSSETSGTTLRTTRCHIPEEDTLQNHRYENLKSYIGFLTVSAIAEEDTAGPVYIREPPNRVDFSNTTGAVVECSARGNPVPEIIWVRSDGTAVGDVPGLRQVCDEFTRSELR
jgi:hypothetical protein